MMFFTEFLEFLLTIILQKRLAMKMIKKINVFSCFFPLDLMSITINKHNSKRNKNIFEHPLNLPNTKKEIYMNKRP